MIIKKYDLEEERIKYPKSVHRVSVSEDGDWIRCKVEYEGKFYKMGYMKQYFGHMDPDDLITITVHHIANKV